LDGNPLFNKEVHEAVKEAGIDASENNINSALRQLERYGNIKSYPPKRGQGIRVIYFLPKDEEEALARYFKVLGDEETLERLRHEKELEQEKQKKHKRAMELAQKHEQLKRKWEQEGKDGRKKLEESEERVKKSMLDLVTTRVPKVCLDGVFLHRITPPRPYIPPEDDILCFVWDYTHKYILEYPKLKQAIEEFWSESKDFWELKKALNKEIELLADEKGKKLSAQERFEVYKQAMLHAGYPPHIFEEWPGERQDIDGKVYSMSSEEDFTPCPDIIIDISRAGELLTVLMRQKENIIEIINGIIQ